MKSSEIVLTTLNAKYIHAAFGLRYLLANLGPLQARTAILEFDINQRTLTVVEELLALNPRIIGLGVYIWNVRESLSVVKTLRALAPQVRIVLGGPEVSHDGQQQEIVQLADVVICGEADLVFPQVCQTLLDGREPSKRILSAPLPELGQVVMPYEFYSDDDVRNRIVYVEASRGCPFTCEFCLSSLDVPVRQFPLEPFLERMQDLYDRGVQHFKFVDRTFNLNLKCSQAILTFFLERLRPGLFLHFEMIPDRLPEGLRAIIEKFPAGVLQFEVGIQTFNEETSKLISRRQNYQRLAENFEFLRTKTGVHIHADLIVGLPGEDLESFGAGFDRLVAMGPQEIQVGILKRLKGTPIVRHDDEWGMVYADEPPFEILQTRLISFSQMQRMRRFARFWDLVGNSGNFRDSCSLIWEDCDSAFDGFSNFSEWLYQAARRRHGIALSKLIGFLFEFLTGERQLDHGRVARVIWQDYLRTGRSDVPLALRPHLNPEMLQDMRSDNRSGLKRQARHASQMPTPE